MSTKRIKQSQLLTALVALPALVLGGSAPRYDPAQELEGLIEPHITVNLSSAVDGLIESVEVDRGDYVEKGEVLARLESSVEELSLELAKMAADAEARVDSAEARLTLERSTRERYEDLYRRKVVSMGELDRARANEDLSVAELLAAKEAKRMAQVEYRRADALLALRTLRSPIDGVVVERHMNEGEFVSRSFQAQIVSIAQIDPLRVDVIAPIRLLGSIQVGDSAIVLPEEPVAGAYEATVTVVDRVVDAASGTFGVRLELPNPERRLPAGLKCQVRFLE